MPNALMKVRDIIDAAFGELDDNVVNFKLLQTVLIILAKQLRLLQRRVEVDGNLGTFRTPSSLSVTEVKLQAAVPKQTNDKSRVSTKYLGSDAQKSSDPASKFTRESLSSAKATQSSSDKTKTTSKNQTKLIASKESTRKEGSKFTSQEYRHILEALELQRERELRVVSQRANSREEAEKTPTPMASLDSMEMQYEKLLVVERVPNDENNEPSEDTKAVQISVVTQEQFDNLAKTVEELQNKFGTIPKPDFPDNMQLMQDLRKGASLTDAMAALQLSARLESAEKTLGQMISLVTDLASQKGIDILQDIEIDSHIAKAIFEAPDSSQPTQQSKKTTSRKHQKKAQKPPKNETSEVFDIDDSLLQAQKDWITPEELDEAMKELYDSLMKSFTNVTSKVTSNAEDALEIAHKLEGKLSIVLNLDSRMSELEALISEYADQINILDTGLSSQMTNYQEQLTLMQHDLESGLEAMGEALANTGGDTTAATELNLNFTNLQLDFDTMNIKQKELKENQDLLSNNIESLWKQIEVLVGIKSDREEVADALRDKAGLGALNGLVNRQQFDAVRGDFEKRIGAAYDKFNNQEIIWQKAIDDLLRELNEKADYAQVVSLRDDVNENLDKLRNRILFMMEIVGEPRAAAISKKLFREAACLSCSSPANMQIEESCLPSLPAFLKAPRSHNIEGEETKPKADGDHKICYPGKPIPHPPDPRSHICRRYCGGSHTKIVTYLKKAPTEIIITSAQHQETNVTNTGGKEETKQQKPCIPCNSSNNDTQYAKTDTDKSQHELTSDSVSTPLDFIQLKSTEDLASNGQSVTPPLPNADDITD